jgi:hypothetical protein
VNESLLNAVVMHVGMKSMESLKPGGTVDLRGTAASEIYRCLATHLDYEVTTFRLILCPWRTCAGDGNNSFVRTH